MTERALTFDLEERYAELSKAGDPLERLLAVVNFEAFRYRLDKALNRSDRAKGGRPPHDAILMFKILVLQALYNLSEFPGPALNKAAVRGRLPRNGEADV